MTLLAGRTAVITGGAGGIGQSVARRFSGAGAQVVLVDVRADEALRTAEALRHEGSSVAVVEGDVSSADTWREAVHRAKDLTGRLDILVNNAYEAVHKPAAELVLEEWRRTLEVSVTAMFLGFKHSLPALREGGGGAVVNVTSVLARTPAPGMPAYSAAKGAVVSLTRQLAIDYGPAGIRTNAVAPGLIAVPATEQTLADPAELRAATESCPLRRVGTAAEVAAVVLFLASDDAAFVNGEVITVDGGTSAQWPMTLLRPGLRRRAGLEKAPDTAAG